MALPCVVASLNLTHPYQHTPLSRVQLLFSPFYYTNMSNLVADPVKLQKNSYLKLNTDRMKNAMLDNKISGKIRTGTGFDKNYR